MKSINIIGNKYNQLLVIDEEIKYDKNTNRPRYYVKCQCDCGNICLKEKSKVKSGYTKSCGCSQTKMRKTLGKRTQQLESGKSVFNEVYNSYKKSAKVRGYSFELDEENFKEIITKNCYYCGDGKRQHYTRESLNGNFEYTGIDRLDSNKGYTLDNVVPCCSICNRMKSNLSKEEFLNHIFKINNMWKRTS